MIFSKKLKKECVHRSGTVVLYLHVFMQGHIYLHVIYEPDFSICTARYRPRLRLIGLCEMNAKIVF